jgi:beta-1,4-mannosyltransferase
MLLEALLMLHQKIEASASSTSTPSPLRVMVVVTGNGPQREEYEERISKLTWEYIAIQTVRVDPGDYPALMACADVGVSLHLSTSGRDLPMKILDWFGCEVPVCAVNFACLRELVQDDVNGRIFETPVELCQQLWDLLLPLTEADAASTGLANHDFGDLKRYSRQIQGRRLWDENWTVHAWPILERAMAKAQQ